MQLVDQIYKILDDTKAVDIQILDVRSLTSVTDYMVVCSGTSGRHVSSLASKLMETLKHQNQVSPLHYDGMATAEWVLVDYVDVVVHIMRPETRAFYNLEGLWGQPTAAAKQQK